MTARHGWHFAESKLRGGSPLPVVGTRLEHSGPVVPCESGYHWSERALDALRYAPGFMVARVVGPEDAKPHGEPVDKYAGAWRENVTPYVGCRAVVLKWAFGEADIAVRVHAVDALRAAGLVAEADKLAALPEIVDAATANAAWAAAGDAARAAVGAAGDAAWAAGGAAWAAWAAAGDAAWAAGDAAWAAGGAAGAAAWAAAGDAARAAGDAARAAAWAAAGDAARAAVGAAGDAAWAAAIEQSNARLEAALSALFVK